MAIVLGLSLLLGCMYSIYHTDPHHWGFILGTAQDYISGKALFSQVYIQYGVGQPVLFKYLNQIFEITYTSIGFVTSVVYALTLLMIFLTLRKFTRNAWLGMGVTATVFLIHPYMIYPWPDYYAGMCLALACFFMFPQQTLAKNHASALAAGICLFLAFWFRNTYLINFSAAILAYTAVAAFSPRHRSRTLAITLLTFVILSGYYLMGLVLQGNAGAWFMQTIGAGASQSQYNLGFRSVLKLLEKILFPTQTTMAVFSVFFGAGLYGAYTFLRNGRPLELFLALLGLAGIVQALMFYEMFRLQNACLPLYFIFVILVGELAPQWAGVFKTKTYRFVLAWYFIFLLLKFPHATSLFPIYDGKRNEYSASTLPYFKGHLFRSDVKAYHEKLAQILCTTHKKIVNRTPDSTIPYLCEAAGAQDVKYESVFNLPFFGYMLLIKINPTVLQEQDAGIFHPDEVIVADSPIPLNPSVKLTQIGEVYRPAAVRFFPAVAVKVFTVESVR
jgi:hypothetical protein